MKIFLVSYLAVMFCTLIVTGLLADLGLIESAPTFAWFDCWMGWYWDGKQQRLYIFFFPMFGLWLGPTKEWKLRRVLARAKSFNEWLEPKWPPSLTGIPRLTEEEVEHVRETVSWLDYLDEQEILRETKRTVAMRLMRQ